MLRFHLRASPLRSLSLANVSTYPASALFAAVSPIFLNFILHFIIPTSSLNPPQKITPLF
jgi:hypothetical protein